MPTQTSAVGGLTLPVPAAGDATTKLGDPIVDGLLDFLAWSLNNDLSTRLAELTGTPATAVPAASGVDHYRSTLDPLEPRGQHVRVFTPALHVWWDGNSTVWSPSQLQGGVQRNINALYIFDELPATAETVRRSGLFAAVNACFTKAAKRGGHPSYSYGGKPNGTSLEDSVGSFATWEWSYLGGRGIKRIGIDDPNTTMTGARIAGRHLPAFAALFGVRERVQPPQPTASDTTTDSRLVLKNDGVEIMDRTFEPDDGDHAEP